MNQIINNPSTVFFGIALAVGMSVAACVWLISRVIADVPLEDREFKDPPPVGFRLLWWPIQLVSHFISPLINEARWNKLASSLIRAGLEYCLTPGQFTASRWVGAAVVALFMCLVLNILPFANIGPATYIYTALIAGVFGWIYPVIWLSERMTARKKELLKTLPFVLDLVTLCVEAGLNIQGAMAQAVAKGPHGVLRDEFMRVLRDIRAGKQRADSLRRMTARLREPGVTSFVTAVIQAEAMGMSLGPVLRAQADQRRSERFLRAEKAAMEAPIKMLFPLIVFIFPCTFIVLFFPIVIKFMASGF